METTITYQLDHESDSTEKLSSLIRECMHLREEDGETAICDICEERMVELAIRKEWSELAVLTEMILMWEPRASLEVL